jgi:DNA-binding GntR family transcriptional regulator
MNLLEKIEICRPPTIREEVYKILRQKILTGEAPPGTKLIEVKLAQEINTSRTPVREALHKLEMENLVESIPRVGYVVRKIGTQDVDEICEIRFSLESLAAKWASEKITSNQLARLEEIISETDRAIRLNETTPVIDLDTEFHDIICHASGSKRLIVMSQTLRDHMLWFRIKGLSIAHIAERANQGHRLIIDAIKSKNFSEIESAVWFHMDQTRKDLKGSMGRDSE